MADAPHEWLTAYLAGDLTRAERVQFEAHLLECPTCLDEAERLSPIVVLLRQLQEGPADEAARRETDRDAVKGARRAWRETLWRSAIAVAAAAVGLLVGLHLRGAGTASVPVERIMISSAREPVIGRIEVYRRPWGSELAGSFVDLPRTGMLRLVVAGPGGTLEAAEWHATRGGHASVVASVPWSGKSIRWMRLYAGSQVVGGWSG
jgi:hypothetical protein